MKMSLFILCCILAICFTMISSTIKRKWIKNSFILYGMLFTATAIMIGFIYVNDHKSVLKVSIKEIIGLEETQYIKPLEPIVSQHMIRDSVQLEAPLIQQLPELPRGCEVTSLAMLLEYNGIEADKMKLAKDVKKDPAEHKVIDNNIHFGNPHNGFVGDMYSFETPGLGVYHQPIAELASEYVGDRVYDFTGGDFSEIIDQLNENHPVWVIINGAYKKLSPDNFITWETIDGPIEITMREHSVLITGYDQEYIYFNDPLAVDQKAPIKDFQEAWIQMGKQAITIH